MSRRHSRSRARFGATPFVGFLLIASFGILFVGCSGPESSPDDDFVVTQNDIERYKQLADSAQNSSVESSAPYIQPLDTASGSQKSDSVELDMAQANAYAAMRAGSNGVNVFQVTNEFLNVRDTPSTGGKNVDRLVFGQSVEVVEFVDGQWAKVKLPSGTTGYVAHKYLSKVTSEERLAEEKKQYENMYYVSFGFVNVRKTADQKSEKIGEIPGQKIVKPLSIENGWAKVSFDGKEGYVSMSYLAPLVPNFIVRQETYELPVLQYKIPAGQEHEAVAALQQHITALRGQGYKLMTMRGLYELLKRQQSDDVRLEPKTIIVAVTGLTAENIRAVSDALTSNNISATLFLETQNVGLSGITEKNLLTLMANGFDIQSAGITGDDLRALTDSQVKLELSQSRKILEDYLKKPVFAIAFPQGGVNDRVAQFASEAGYLLGLGTDADRSFTRGQFLRIPSMIVVPSMSTEEVVKFVKGS